MGDEKRSNNRELFIFFPREMQGRQVFGTAEVQDGGLLLDGAGYCAIHFPFVVVLAKAEESNIATPDGQPPGANVGVMLEVPSPFAAGAPLHAHLPAFMGPIKDQKLKLLYSQQVKELRFRMSGLHRP